MGRDAECLQIGIRRLGLLGRRYQLGYFALRYVTNWEPTLLGFVAASMIYVAVADLIPGLHRRPELRDTASQALLIALGIAAIAAVRAVVAH